MSGRYDFYLEFLRPEFFSIPEAARGPDGDGFGQDIDRALEQQLGLRLVKGKAKLDVIVVEKVADLPTEN